MNTFGRRKPSLLRHLAAAVLLLALAGVAQAAPATAPFPHAGVLEYKIYMGEYTKGIALGRARIQIESDGRNYRLRNQAELIGLLKLFYQGVWIDQSRGRLGPDGTEPERYSEWRRTKPERWIGVDYDSRRVQVKAVPEGLALRAGAQDRLSVLWYLGMIARANPELVAAGKVFEVPLLSFRSINIARFESFGEQVLPTDSGPLRTLYLSYREKAEKPSGIEVWLGIEQQMQPVRIRYREGDSETFDMVLERSKGPQ